MILRPLRPLRRLCSIVWGCACVLGVLLLALPGCGSVANKPSGTGGATGAGGSGAGGAGGVAPTDGGSGGISGTGGAPGDAGADKVTPPPDGGGDGAVGGSDGGTNPNGAKWDVDNWDNAQWS